MENPLLPVNGMSVFSTESILARGGRSERSSSMSLSPESVSMITSEPSFHTVPEASQRSAARYTAGLNPTPWTVPLIVILMRAGCGYGYLSDMNGERVRWAVHSRSQSMMLIAFIPS